MKTRVIGSVLVVLAVLALAALPWSGSQARAQAGGSAAYKVDPAHTTVAFCIRHAGISPVYGVFGEPTGQFTINESDPGKSSFELSIPTAGVFTANQRRDDHLRSDDFFDVKQFPAMTFKSSGVKAIEGGYEVAGDLTLHGKTKPVTVTLKGGDTTEFPKGTPRIGFAAQTKIKRSDFGVGSPKFDTVLGDEVEVMIGMEGTR